MNILLCALMLAIASTSCVAQSTNPTCGSVSHATQWKRTDRYDTIRMDINTSVCRFTATPLYFTSVAGGVGHYLLTGVNAIYEPTNIGFTIYVRSTDGANADTLMARSAQWSILWMGLR